MKKRTTRPWRNGKSLLLCAATSLLVSGIASAQDPGSVDIDLQLNALDSNKLEVYLKANGSYFEDVLSGLTFTIRWVTTSPATLGPRVNSCPDAILVNPTAQITDPVVDGNPTGFNYRTYNAFGTELLSDWGCTLPQDTWLLITSIPVQNDTSCTEFQIVNDEFTSSPGNARDFYISLGGIDKTGIIEPTPVLAGDCNFNVGAVERPNIPSAFEVSPSPTNGLVHINVPSRIHGPIRCDAFDVTGRRAAVGIPDPRSTSGAWMIDLSGEADGVYLIMLDTGDERLARRVVKR